VLLHNNFTPFIIVFLHAIVATSLEDVQLLDEIVKILSKVNGASKDSERMYQICSTFAKLARTLVETKNSSVGIYNSQEGSIQFTDSSVNTQIFQNDVFYSTFEDMTGVPFEFNAHEISNLIANWASGDINSTNMMGSA
jgi:hypothetical protein